MNLSWSLTKPIIESIRTSIKDFDVYTFREMEAIHKYAGVKVAEPVPSDVFRKAASRIFKLMEQDSFVRFSNSRRSTDAAPGAEGDGRRSATGGDHRATAVVPGHQRHISTWESETDMPSNVV